ncbi:hypothetical protein [Thermomonas fusca]|uniref:hypothetical protein n=1 Tax=Thermomonas fusca TaxID=215690 RepID=UPI000412AE12|nr:hypothetical protein [Thermomonas fusca]
MRYLLLAAAMLLPYPAASAPTCNKEAIVQAKRLLLFHTDGDDRAVVESTATPLASIRNPANKNQRFLVLQVEGSVYKADYTMRLIYYPMGRECVLMGQEILEHASL